MVIGQNLRSGYYIVCLANGYAVQWWAHRTDAERARDRYLNPADAWAV